MQKLETAYAIYCKDCSRELEEFYVCHERYGKIRIEVPACSFCLDEAGPTHNELEE